MHPQYLLHYIILSTGVNSFILFIYLSYYSQILSTKYFAKFNCEYDYIIVGSGTAGSVVAHRLATETNFTFIVIEAGGHSNPLFEIPVLGPLLHGSVFDWQYETVPQDNACLAMKDKKCRLPQGKIVGGSSKLNNMVHVRGNVSHYTEWFQRKYDEDYMNSHFEYIEKSILHLNEMQFESELTAAVLEAAKELGYNTLGGAQDNFTKSKLSQSNGKRWSASDNLDLNKHVLTNALVEKVIIKNKAARGVKILITDQTYNIYARKGVILTAGTFNTPKILQLSGIGPTNLLKSLNIPVVTNLPVGYNLQDHIATGLDLILINNSLSVNAMNMLDLFHVYDYFINGKGPLTTPGCETIGFLSTRGDGIQDIQFMVMPVGLSSDRGSYLRIAMGINDTIWENYFVNIFDKHAATILPIILHPKSKGEVFITNTDATSSPRIDPKYLSNNEDVKTLIGGLKLVLQFLNTTSMKDVGAFINPHSFPGCEHLKMFSNSYWECYIRYLTLTSYHPVGTCSMGMSKSNSVVDTSFRVFGVKSLYVADASVLPTLPSGNINAAVAMMASVFFDENIKSLNQYAPGKRLECPKDQLLFEFIYNMCMNVS